MKSGIDARKRLHVPPYKCRIGRKGAFPELRQQSRLSGRMSGLMMVMMSVVRQVDADRLRLLGSIGISERHMDIPLSAHNEINVRHLLNAVAEALNAGRRRSMIHGRHPQDDIKPNGVY